MICDDCRNKRICIQELLINEINSDIDIPEGIEMGVIKCKLFRKLPEKKPEIEYQPPEIISPMEGCPWCGSPIELEPKKRATTPCPSCSKPIHIREDYTVVKGRIKKGTAPEQDNQCLIKCPNREHILEGTWNMAGQEIECKECKLTFTVTPDDMMHRPDDYAPKGESE